MDNKPPGVDISIAANYRDGGIWISIGDMPRLLNSPDDARAFAEVLKNAPATTEAKQAEGYEHFELIEKIETLADDIEEASGPPNKEKFADISPDDYRVFWG
jgi:hypothetical protein